MTSKQEGGNDFNYESLGDGEIRVLDLLPGRWNHELCGRVKTIHLDDTEYEALSYVWGPQTLDRSLCLDGQYHFAITDNLFLALRRLRRKRQVRTLWVDAICINQKDDSEKGRQVRDMGEIYASATVVNVWLGESKQARSIHLRCLFGLPHDIGFNITASNWPNELPRNLLAASYRILSDVTWALQRRETGESSELAIPPWHSRAWTAQEFIVARRVRLCLGRAAVTTNFNSFSHNFCREQDVCCKLGWPDGHLWYLLRKLMRLGWTNSVYNKQRHCDMASMMWTLETASATEPRDMAYSVAGVLPDREKRVLRLDYNLEYAEVCCNATAASLQSGLAIILFRKAREESNAHSLASWVVDFANKAEPDLNAFAISILKRRFCHDISEYSRLEILGRDIGVVGDCRPMLTSDWWPFWLNAVPRRVLAKHYVSGSELLDDQLLNACFDICGGVESGNISLIQVGNGIFCLGPGSVQANDKLVRLCFRSAFALSAPEVAFWLCPQGDHYLFRGLAVILGDTVSTIDYERPPQEDLQLEDDRPWDVMTAGFQTYNIR